MKRQIFLLVWLILAVPCQAKIIYVDTAAPGANNGSSWINSYKFLQDALADANSSAKPVEIRVAQGVYTPDSNSEVLDGTGDREATFQLIDGVILKGGYPGFDMTDPNARNLEAYETILSGDLDGNDIDVNDPRDLFNEPTRAENSYHVITGSGTYKTAILDGFTITGSNADVTCYLPYGGGMYNFCGNPTINNCRFWNNSASRGGGIYNCGSWPTVTNCSFKGNYAYDGGGLHNYWGSNSSVTNCTFEGNSAKFGGAISNEDSSPTLTNCVFKSNRAYAGGGLDMYGSHSILTNCTFIANSAEHGGGIFNLCPPPPPPPQPPPPTDICNMLTLINCVFIKNSAEVHGGGMYNSHGSHTLTNCLFAENSAPRGGGIYNHSKSNLTISNCTFCANAAAYGTALACGSDFDLSNLNVINCILWNVSDEIWNSGNSVITVTYSDVQGGQSGIYDPCSAVIWGKGNIDTDPCFADANNGDYFLKSQAGRWDPNTQSWVQDDSTSPCIDAGNPLRPFDFEPFPNGGIINMGAYGGTTEASKSYFSEPACETIVAGDINGDCIINFKDFSFMALHWLEDNRPLQLPPGHASNPTPKDGAEIIDPDANLNWMAGFSATSHDVYFGTSSPPPFIRNQTSTTFDPGTMPLGYWHFWRIDELNVWGKTIGQVWSFRIPGPQPPPPPPPPP